VCTRDVQKVADGVNVYIMTALDKDVEVQRLHIEKPKIKLKNVSY
jgi:hypothetical protein